MKFSPKAAPLLSAALMSILLPFLMTFFITLVNLGWSEVFVPAWMRAWGIASVIAFPAILILSPLVKRLVGTLASGVKS